MAGLGPEKRMREVFSASEGISFSVSLPADARLHTSTNLVSYHTHCLNISRRVTGGAPTQTLRGTPDDNASSRALGVSGGSGLAQGASHAPRSI